jgi:uncharacterized circularly permuted ATP-grasp superfamily protein
MAGKAYFDEMGGKQPRPPYRQIAAWLERAPKDLLAAKRREAEALYRRHGITFGAYGAVDGHETTIPFDLIPRVLTLREWQFLERGLVQRVKALNAFLADAYHKREICRAGKLPEEQVLLNEQFLGLAQGIDLPGGVHAHIAGIDLVRVGEDEFYVLEDNVRTPSGVSYMLENREVMMRLFPDLFQRHAVQPVGRYTEELLNTLRSVSFSQTHEPCVVLLTPGQFNSAYFEHAFLAQQMGVELVEAADLFVRDGRVWMRTTAGAQRVDVIYRRIDDPYLDPLAFRADSLLGVPGLLSVYRAGRVGLANAIGTGVADDKSTYPYVPDMIRYYLAEDPILANVPTLQCRRPEELDEVLERLPELVVKEVQGSGGYGMLVGPAATREEIETFRARLKSNPTNYIAQPTLSLSTCPTFVEQGIAPRHIDLRPFVLSGREVRMVPGGLTRVALKEGSLVVNSSQGGGTKDTWVLAGGDVPESGPC